MDGLVKVTEKINQEEEFSFKNPFIPITNVKAFILLASVGILVFFNTLFNGFLLDDLFQVLNNQYTQSNIFYYFTHEIGPYYRPLMLMSFSIIYQMVGTQPFLYHLWQVTLQIINSCLLYVLFAHFIKKKNVALFLSLIFLAHPINSETVDYVSLLQDVYFVFFGLLSFVLIIKKGPGTLIYIISSILLLLALFSKESGGLFIIAQLCYVLFYQRKYFLKMLSFSVAVVFVYIATRYIIFGHIISPNNFLFTINKTVSVAPFAQRLINIPDIFLYYFKTFLFPINLSTDQLWWHVTITFSSFYLPLIIDLVILLGMIITGFTISKKNTKDFIAYLFFFIWFLVGIGFHSQILPLDSTVADHFFYFPMIGLLGMIGISFQQLFHEKNIPMPIIVICFLILASLSLRTIIRNTNWYSPLTIGVHDIKVSPDSVELQYALGLAYQQSGDAPDSIKYIKEAMKSSPNNYLMWQNLGSTYFTEHDYKDAALSFEKTIRIKHDFFAGYYDLAEAYLYNLKPESAKKIIEEKMIKQWPNDAASWSLLGFADYLLNDKSAALSDFKKAYELDPSTKNANNYNTLLQNEPVILQL